MRERAIDTKQMEREEIKKSVEDPPVSAVIEGQEVGMDEITVHYPEQLFGPVPYMSFRVGGIYYKTVVRPGETPEIAYKRAWEFISNRVREQYIQVKKEFWQRHDSMNI